MSHWMASGHFWQGIHPHWPIPGPLQDSIDRILRTRIWRWKTALAQRGKMNKRRKKTWVFSWDSLLWAYTWNAMRKHSGDTMRPLAAQAVLWSWNMHLPFDIALGIINSLLGFVRLKDISESAAHVIHAGWDWYRNINMSRGWNTGRIKCWVTVIIGNVNGKAYVGFLNVNSDRDAKATTSVAMRAIGNYN